MIKKLLLAITIICFAAAANAQNLEYTSSIQKAREQNTNIDTVAWVYNGNFSLGGNVGLLHNWPAGGELASLTVNSLFNGSLIRYNHRHLWSNNLDMAYGLLYTYSNEFLPRKTDDRLDFTSKYGYQLKDSSNWYATVLFNAKTQFTKAYNYEEENYQANPISGAFSPLYATVAPGIEYRRGSSISVFFSPIASRATFVSKRYTTSNPEGAYGVAQGEISRYELGAYLTARYYREFTPNFSYRGRFDLYSNYLAKDQYTAGVLVKKNNPGNVDLLWDNVFVYKFFKYFSINLGILGIYDNDVPYEKFITDPVTGTKILKDDPTRNLGWWQLKQSLSLGFNYKF